MGEKATSNCVRTQTCFMMVGHHMQTPERKAFVPRRKPIPVEVVVGDSPAAWRNLGFRVEPDGTVRFGEILLRLVGGPRRGLLAWSLSEYQAIDGTTQLDGIPTEATAQWQLQGPPSAPHPNGITGLDCLVIRTPDWKRTVEVFSQHLASWGAPHHTNVIRK